MKSHLIDPSIQAIWPVFCMVDVGSLAAQARPLGLPSVLLKITAFHHRSEVDSGQTAETVGRSEVV